MNCFVFLASVASCALGVSGLLSLLGLVWRCPGGGTARCIMYGARTSGAARVSARAASPLAALLYIARR